MPRRRKTHKKSLSFEESPKNIVRQLPEPVYGAEHPTTAKVVPLCEVEHVPWVSPDDRLAAGGRQPRRRTSHVLHTTSASPKPKRNNKRIKPLRFVDDSSIEELLIKPKTPCRIAENASASRAPLAEFSNIHTPTSVNTIAPQTAELPPQLRISTSELQHTPSLCRNNANLSVIPNKLLSPERLSRNNATAGTNETPSLNKENQDNLDNVCSRPDEDDWSNCQSTLKDAKQILQNIGGHESPIIKRTRNWQVLVFDTPEDEYGLSMRERRLRSREKMRSKHKI